MLLDRNISSRAVIMDIAKYLPTILKFSGLFSRACSKYHSVELISVKIINCSQSFTKENIDN